MRGAECVYVLPLNKRPLRERSLTMSMDSNNDAGSIAIVGMAGRFPAASSISELWKMLREGREATQWMTAEELREAGVSDTDIGTRQTAI